MNTQQIAVSSGSIGGNACQTVNARDLHFFLENRRQFADWIKQRIGDYGFQEGIDFEVFHNSVKNPQGGRDAKDYRLTLDMAKELAMVERTPKGREARRYFIACEKELLRLKANPTDLYAQAPEVPFDRVCPHTLDSLRRINRNLAQAYLVARGITPDYVAGLLAHPTAAGDYGRDPADVAPLSVLRGRVPQYAALDDAECWYLHRKDWETACQGYSATRTAHRLAELGYLRHDPGKLQMKAKGSLFGDKNGKKWRPYVYAVRKTLADVAGLPTAQAGRDAA